MGSNLLLHSLCYVSYEYIFHTMSVEPPQVVKPVTPPPQEKKEEEKEEVEDKKDILSVVKPVIPQRKDSMARSDNGQRKPILETGPPRTKPVGPTINSIKIESNTRLNTEYKTKQHNLFKSFKNKSSLFYNSLFSKITEFLNKTYIGRFLKGFIYYIITVQIWLCVVASLFIYFRKTYHKR